MKNLSLILLSLLGIHCGNSSVSTQGASCTGSSAVIGIYDGVFVSLCGCAEGAGVSSQPGTPLTCTINSGSSVIFQNIQSTLKHQIQFSNNSLGASQLFDPQSPTQNSWGTTFPMAGTFSFIDTFTPGMTGQIIAL